jgi:hypothetical protein
MTPEQLFEAEWEEVPIPRLIDPAEMFVWIPDKGDAFKRTLRCVKEQVNNTVYVIVYDRWEEPTQAWRVKQ